MYSTGKFKGHLRVDGVPRGAQVAVSLDETLSMAPHPPSMSSPYVALIPVTPAMLLVQDPALMVRGLHYEVRGEHLGWVSVGSAADGYENHAVTAFEMRVRYSAAGIHVEIDGQTLHHGQGQPSAHTYPPEPQTFSVHFDLPRDALGAFFGLSEARLAYTMARFDQCFGPAS
ncbi:hypothetical protein QRD43_01885 [Pelomonas sp. APW6]|uniref:Uncharacterized protein n=1 Tax=Roseateles subflavus TaxID=3053353 RepID=A0ABT7LEC7_9BURK|nr:hypothetical protein [Pelomonas sp. APW6]MDL5030642.1 hypothetical protein [Pelomonas sp. APW6]